MNLRELRERVKWRYRDPKHLITSQEQWDGHLNAAYYEFLMEASWPLTQEAVTVDVGVSGTAPFPAKINRVVSATVDGLSATFKPWGRNPDSLDDTDSRYVLVRGDELIVRPKPTFEVPVVLNAYVFPDPLETPVDEPVLPPSTHEALVIGALSIAHADDSNLEAASWYRQDFERYVDRARKELLGPRTGLHPVPSALRSRRP